MIRTLIQFSTGNKAHAAAYTAALEGLEANIHQLPQWENPVLFEGADYPGMWLEGGPHESLLYGAIDAQVAVDGHRIFFANQEEDGFIPSYFLQDLTGRGQIQSVVPLALTSLGVFDLTDDWDFLEEAYSACGRYDAWLRRYRDTRGTGLCEAFCEYDTGHDRSPRMAGLPHFCPDKDARNCPDLAIAPFLAPDMSSMVYGGRRALASMARLLGRHDEAVIWDERAETIRQALFRYCYDEADICFYDLNAKNEFVKVRGDAMLRVLSDRVLEPALFEKFYNANVANPARFWTPYPLPSVSIDDPAFDRAMGQNTWGGPSQALQAIRAPLWLDHYGKSAALAHLMRQWLEALSRAGVFRQQLNPWTGEVLEGGDGYSPALLAMTDFTARLHGVRYEGGLLHWGCEAPGGSSSGEFAAQTKFGAAKICHDNETSVLYLNDQEVLVVQGACRIATDSEGAPVSLTGTASEAVTVTVSEPGRVSREIWLEPNAVIDLSENKKCSVK